MLIDILRKAKEERSTISILTSSGYEVGGKVYSVSPVLLKLFWQSDRKDNDGNYTLIFYYIPIDKIEGVVVSNLYFKPGDKIKDPLE